MPEKILLFEVPDALDDGIEDGWLWHDVDGRRFFSNTFYADLLRHLGVALVMSLGDDSGPGAAGAASRRQAVFDAHGIDICTSEDLVGDCGAGRFSLQSMDRFMAVTDGHPGPVAVICGFPNSGSGSGGGIGGGGGGSDAACTHLTAYLLRMRYFPGPSEAVAWLRMVRPGKPATIDCEALAAAVPRGRRRRSASICVLVDDPAAVPAAAAAAAAAATMTEAAAAAVSATAEGGGGGGLRGPAGGGWLFSRGFSMSSPQLRPAGSLGAPFVDEDVARDD